LSKYDDHKNLKVPLGRHKGKTLGMIRDQGDLQYLDWLADQGWFRERFGPIRARIVDFLKDPAVARELEDELSQRD
jgi:hypothetical protein